MRIVVGFDGSHGAHTAVRWTAQLPLRAEDEVVLVAVAQRPVLVGTLGYLHTAEAMRLADSALEAARAHASETLAEAAATVGATGCAVRTMVREGHPVDELGRTVAEVGGDILVLGPHGRGRLTTLLLGSTSQGLLQALSTTTVVAREPVRPIERVLVAVDGSGPSLHAARLLTRIPLPAGAEIHALAVTGSLSMESIADADVPLAGALGDAAGASSDLVEVEQTVAEAVLDAACDILQSSRRPLTRHVRRGDAKVEILGLAAELDADLVATGARGVGGFAGLILGSVSRAVSRAAPCSTLVAVEAPGRDGAVDVRG
jgi:nucleotide-binding universal stress UspA family protein